MKDFNVFIFMIQVTLIVLKLLGIFNHSLLIIFLPTIVYFGLVLLILVILGILVIIIASLNKNSKQ